MIKATPSELLEFTCKGEEATTDPYQAYRWREAGKTVKAKIRKIDGEIITVNVKGINVRAGKSIVITTRRSGRYEAKNTKHDMRIVCASELFFILDAPDEYGVGECGLDERILTRWLQQNREIKAVYYEDAFYGPCKSMIPHIVRIDFQKKTFENSSGLKVFISEYQL